MFTVTGLDLAIPLCIVTMLGWGSWANTQKLAGKTRWQFPLYYWDYAIGVVLLSLLFLFGLGGRESIDSLTSAATGAIHFALFSGVIFNISNILLVVAIDAAGMSVAFPVGVGLALVIGTVTAYMQAPKGNATLLFGGVAMVVLAMVMSALAYRKLPQRSGRNWARGLIFSIIAGCLMGFFYPYLSATIGTSPGSLTPYAGLFYFALGLLASNFVVNTVFMRSEKVSYADYFRGSLKLHSLGILGGMIWMLALSFNILAAGVAGPAISYALGQGATLVAAIWGVFIWREFRDAPAGTNMLIALMFAGYTIGLILIGAATL